MRHRPSLAFEVPVDLQPFRDEEPLQAWVQKGAEPEDNGCGRSDGRHSIPLLKAVSLLRHCSATRSGHHISGNMRPLVHSVS